MRIAALYDALAQLAPSPVVELNRAVAYSMAFGPEVALELVDAVAARARRCGGYHLLPSVRGDLLEKLGRFDEARREFEQAAALTRNTRERTLLLERGARRSGGACRSRAARSTVPELSSGARTGAGSPARRPPARRVAGRR